MKEREEGRRRKGKGKEEEEEEKKKRKRRDPTLLLKDILDNIARIERFTKDISNAEDLASNELVYYAVLKALENIGEAAKNVPEDLKSKYQVEWRKISGLRDIIVHNYFGLDHYIIWDIIKNKLQELKGIVVRMLGDIKH